MQIRSLIQVSIVFIISVFFFVSPISIYAGDVTDSDNDGLSDDIEAIWGSDPDDADSDDDGIEDGAEDRNRDGQLDVRETSPIDPDTDDDGICDGTRQDNDDDGLNPLDPCVGSESLAGTDPADPDTDDDGIIDGLEDRNGDGVVDGNETPALDADADDDGLSDGVELNDLNINPNNPDTDSDDLNDGLEMGVVRPVPAGFSISGIPFEGTDETKRNYFADQDSSSRTDPLDPDSDNDSLKDGIEDFDRDGFWDYTEPNPMDGDTDDDGLSDGEEDANFNGRKDFDETDPVNPDSDDDSLNDGLELGLTAIHVIAGHSDGLGLPYAGTARSWTPDSDGSTVTNPNERDSDRDGLDDGLEDENWNGSRDAGETDPLDADSDDDSLLDAEEDANLNGRVSSGETDPLDPDTDDDGLCDAERTDNDGNGIDPDDPCISGENTWGSNPLLPDSDDDGYSDGREVALGSHPMDKLDQPDDEVFSSSFEDPPNPPVVLINEVDYD